MKLSTLFKTIPIERAFFISPFTRTDREERVAGSDTEMGLSPEVSHAFSPDTDIATIHYRAQHVEPGGLFVAVPGLTVDGYDFVEQALEKGAVAVVSQHAGHEWKQKPYDQKWRRQGFTYIQVQDARKILPDISAAFYDDPSGKMIMIGITGTNGKTTTARLIENMMQTTGEINPGVIGTHNYRYDGQIYDNSMTTPEAPELQKILSDMVNGGISHVVMEVSSHGIDRYRVDHCWFDVGVFTNLSQDHLDYHGTMDAYWSCKKKWFTDYIAKGPKKNKAKAVINYDHPKGRELTDILKNSDSKLPVIPVGRHKDCLIRPDDLALDLTGIAGRVSTPRGRFRFKTSLVGEYNLENILCALGVGEALGLSLESMKKAIESISSIPGRLEPVPNDHQRFIYVDYAHTPDALTRVLTTLRSLTTGRIVCVFGCGGDRDREKRPLMGGIAARLCDLCVVTSDNPRTEDPNQIIDQICRGMGIGGLTCYQPSELEDGFNEKGVTIEPDRKRAISLGIRASDPGDTILISGKGNETYQILGKEVIAFDDRQEARKILSAGLDR